MKLQLLTLGAIAFLAACGGEASNAPAKQTTTSATTVADSAPAPVDMARAKGLFDGTCAACHGATGKGDGPGAASLNPKPRDFSNKDYMTRLTDTEIRNTIKYGGGIKGMPQMPSHPQFNEADLAALVAYVRTLSTTQ